MADTLNLITKWTKLIGGEDILSSRLFEYNLNVQESKSLFKRFIKVINLETFSYCNRKCTYCPVSMLETKEKQYLDDGIFKSIINSLEAIEYESKISLNLYNEPLSDNSIFQSVLYIRNRLPRAIVSFNSNGDYITEEILEKLALIGLDNIHITLHTTPNEIYSDTLAEKKLEDFYKKINQVFKIESQKVNEYIRTSFKYKNLHVSIATSNYAKFGESRAGILSDLIEKDILRNWPCGRPYREFTIFSNGHVYPCCNIYAPLDNYVNSIDEITHNNDIFQIYTSRKMVDLRKMLFDYSEKLVPCDKCTEPFLHSERIKLI